MKDIIELIYAMDNVIYGTEVPETEIQQAEKILGLSFSEDYHKYIKHFGCMSIDCREITGLSEQKNYNVVDVTLSQRQYNKNINNDFYVIEQLNIDNIVIWQSSSGEIYQTQSLNKPIKIYDSLYDYLTKE